MRRRGSSEAAARTFGGDLQETLGGELLGTRHLEEVLGLGSRSAGHETELLEEVLRLGRCWHWGGVCTGEVLGLETLSATGDQSVLGDR